MNAALLLEHYAQIADAPDAIARLRRFILDLAVRGKLVEQDPNDEPASELLKRIAAEKAHLIKQRAIKKSEVPSISAEEEPYPVKANWAWTRLGDIGDWGAGSTPPRGNADLYGGGITWLKSGELNDNRELAGSEETVTEHAVKTGSFRLNKPGDVLIAMYGATIGKLAVLAEEAVTNQAVCGCTPFSGVSNQYLFLFLMSQREQFHDASEGGAQPNISKVKIVNTAFPLPPLAEQHRIVAKVDELMALCDQLETARAERETGRDKLTLSTLAKLNEPDPQTFADDARFALEHLEPLTKRTDQIKQLKQTILNLAVRGKLVEQDENDEPASKLLENILKQREEMIRAGEIRRDKPLNGIKDAELPFQLPQGWAWSRLGGLIHLVSGQHLQPSEYTEGPSGDLPYITGPSDFGDQGLKISRFALVRKAVAKRDQLLLTVKGSGVGKTTTCDLPEVAISRQLMALTAIGWDRRFLNLLTHPLAELLQESARSLIPGIAREDVEQFVVAVAPLAEQNRIVAKVDELIALCDQLEASITEGEQTRSKLLEAVLHEALEPA